VKLHVLVWTADCEESNKQAMENIISVSQDGALGNDLKYLNPFPETVHLLNLPLLTGFYIAMVSGSICQIFACFIIMQMKPSNVRCTRQPH
jgi:hypothetical protein